LHRAFELCIPEVLLRKIEVSLMSPTEYDDHVADIPLPLPKPKKNWQLLTAKRKWG
jgi:hypothetical protein